MDLKEIVEIVQAEVICDGGCDDQDMPVVAFASDLMSEVLTIVDNGVLLITGLANQQTIRTAEMSDISYILLVRNKQATPEMITLAQENGIVLLQCSYSMYKTCGLLYQAGLEAVY